MKYENWTKWYRNRAKTIDNQSRTENDLLKNLNEKERKTAELLIKHYRKIENRIADADDKLKIEKNKSERKALQERANEKIAKDLIAENSVSKGDNRALSSEIQSKKVEQAKKISARSNEIELQENENEIVNELNNDLNEIERNADEEIKKVKDEYQKKQNETYDKVKKEIDEILSNNISDKNGVYYDVKNLLLKEIESNRENLGDLADALIEYVNDLDFVERQKSEDVTLYVNDRQLTIRKADYDHMDKIKFDTYGRVGLIYGDLLTFKYDGKEYKARAGDVASENDKNVVKAICSRKKITARVGTCIMYNGKVYMYSGDNLWRVAQERYKVNAKDGLYALVTDYKAKTENKNE